MAIGFGSLFNLGQVGVPGATSVAGQSLGGLLRDQVQTETDEQKKKRLKAHSRAH